MGSFSNFLEAKLLDLVWGANAITASGTLYVGLDKSGLSDVSTGITADEPQLTVGGNPTAYARVAVTNNSTNFPNATGSPTLKQNGTAINFPVCTTDWGEVITFFFADTPTRQTGSILGWGLLTTAKTISSGDSASFAINSIQITLD